MTVMIEPRKGIYGFAWANHDTLGKCMWIVPLAVGALSCISDVFPKNTQEKAMLYEKTVEAFCKKDEETQKAYYYRIAKGVCKVALSTALISVAWQSSPLEWKAAGIAVALRASSYFLFREGKVHESIKDFALPRKQEPLDQARVRIGMGGAALLGCITLGVLSAIYYPQVLQKSTEYRLWLPFQNKASVFFEYCTFIPFFLGAGYLDYRKSFEHGKKQENFRALWHGSKSVWQFANAGLSLFFATDYTIHDCEARIHHSWFGQALKLLPFWNFKILGSSLSMSSLIYILAEPSAPGYYKWIQYPNGRKSLKELVVYGLDNVYLDYKTHFSLASLGIALEGIGKDLRSWLYSPKDSLVHLSVIQGDIENPMIEECPYAQMQDLFDK